MIAASAWSAACSSARSLSNVRTITASRCAALTAAASGAAYSVTSPEPILRPARAASRAAPVLVAPPLTTIRRPRACLCASTDGQGNCVSQSSGLFSNV